MRVIAATNADRDHGRRRPIPRGPLYRLNVSCRLNLRRRASAARKSRRGRPLPAKSADERKKGRLTLSRWKPSNRPLLYAWPGNLRQLAERGAAHGGHGGGGCSRRRSCRPRFKPRVGLLRSHHRRGRSASMSRSLPAAVQILQIDDGQECVVAAHAAGCWVFLAERGRQTRRWGLSHEAGHGSPKVARPLWRFTWAVAHSAILVDADGAHHRVGDTAALGVERLERLHHLHSRRFQGAGRHRTPTGGLLPRARRPARTGLRRMLPMGRRELGRQRLGAVDCSSHHAGKPRRHGRRCASRFAPLTSHRPLPREPGHQPPFAATKLSRN